MNSMKHLRIEELTPKHKARYDGYEYYRRDFVPTGYVAGMLTNTSSTENLVCIDFDVIHDLDVAIYRDSN